MKRVLGPPAVGHGIREGPQHMAELEDGAGPAVAEEQRSSVRLRGAEVDKVHGQGAAGAIQGDRELGPAVEQGLATAPVVVRAPVGQERLKVALG